MIRYRRIIDVLFDKNVPNGFGVEISNLADKIETSLVDDESSGAGSTSTGQSFYVTMTKNRFRVHDENSVRL